MANTIPMLDLDEPLQEQVDTAVATFSAAEACKMLCFYVLCTGDQMSMRDEETQAETPRGVWMRTIARRVAADQGFDPSYFDLPPGATS